MKVIYIHSKLEYVQCSPLIFFDGKFYDPNFPYNFQLFSDNECPLQCLVDCYTFAFINEFPHFNEERRNKRSFSKLSIEKIYQKHIS